MVVTVSTLSVSHSARRRAARWTPALLRDNPDEDGSANQSFEAAGSDVMIIARLPGHDHMPAFRALIGTLAGGAQAR
jgi:hypothetical protein